MATDDDPPAGARPATDPGRESRDMREASEKLNERLTDRIRQGPVPPPPGNDDKLNDTIRQRLEHLVPELVKKTFAAGLGAVFSTEEGIRKIAREVSLPDVVGYVASSADGAKDRVFEIVARETREFLANLNLTEEIAKILTTLSLEIKTEIRFIPNDQRLLGSEPDVKASVRVKKADDGKPKDKDSKDLKDKPEEERDSRSRLRFWRREDGTEEGGDDDGGGGHDR